MLTAFFLKVCFLTGKQTFFCNTIYIMDIVSILIGFIAGAVIALAAYILFRRSVLKGKREEILEKAEIEGEKIKNERILQAKEKYLSLKSEHEKAVNEKNAQLRDAENRIRQKESNLNQKLSEADRKSKEVEAQKATLTAQQEVLKQKEEEYEGLRSQVIRQIETIAGMSAAEAKTQLVESMKAEARTEAQAYINDCIDEARLNAAKEAKRIVINTIQRTATETAIENAVTTFPIENDEIKGRIIGREGRNIRALEAATGVEIVVDDTPDAILLSAFDPVRREVARLALHQLVVDGRIHPARIEEMVEKAKKEVSNQIREAGEAAVLEVGVHGLHHELIRYLGRMKYRTSYGQNVLNHSIEVAHLAGIMAAEVGANVALATRAGLLHDIGKSIDHEVEGSHVEIGADLAKKYRENNQVIHCIMAHHNDVEPQTLEAVLVQAADAISAARPGARRETLETYIKRLEKLEEIANSFDGVDNSYAIQAGREVRIIVKPDKVSDADTVLLAKDIAKRIENEMDYPGQIKVNVIRETRTMELAK